MLAMPVAELPAETGWTFEPKWDGYRAIGNLSPGGLRVSSRRGTNMAPWFPELEPLSDALAGHHLLVDGEVVALDPTGGPDFAALQHRAHQRPTRGAGQPRGPSR
jgi:bifunctional non-homologous end joining protein LigD